MAAIAPVIATGFRPLHTVSSLCVAAPRLYKELWRAQESSVHDTILSISSRQSLGVMQPAKEQVKKCSMLNALAVFAKAPIAGQVKTRLCPPLTFEEAAELYRCFLIDSVSRACTLADVHICLAFTPAHSAPLFREVLRFPLRYIPQRGASLGEREANLFTELLQAGYARVVIVGSDIPTLPLAHLRDAFALLADPRNDVVIGPSKDGGYYLLGARQLHPALFENIPWSTSSVFAETLEQARHSGLTVAQVPAWYDVDAEAELQQLAVELIPPEHAARAPRTRALLARLGFLSA